MSKKNVECMKCKHYDLGKSVCTIDDESPPFPLLECGCFEEEEGKVFKL